MPYYLIEDFQRGVDVRRSAQTSPPGSLRVLRNAFINAGGEIEKRLGWHLEGTFYSAFKKVVAGPFATPGMNNSLQFRLHYTDTSFPSDVIGKNGVAFGTTAGAGYGGTSYAEYLNTNTAYDTVRFWFHLSSDAGERHASPFLLHQISLSGFGSQPLGSPAVDADEFVGQVYSIDSILEIVGGSATGDWENLHLLQDILNTGEPFSFRPQLNLSNPDSSYVHQISMASKSFIVAADELQFSAINLPLDFVDTGSGLLQLTSQGGSIGSAVGLGQYFDQLAVFGELGVQFYSVDPDPDLTQYQRTVYASLVAARTITQYSSGDVLYLGSDGIRSLQARDSSNFAAIDDIGSPVDNLVRADLADNSSVTLTIGGSAQGVILPRFLRLALGIVHRSSGQFWLFLRRKVYVLSRHPSSNVLAWSTFELPDASSPDSDLGNEVSAWCADACVVGQTICLRNFGGDVLVYGGFNNDTYDNSEVEAVTPFMDMERPGDNKYFTGIDLVCEGVWTVQACVEPKAEGQALDWFTIAVIDGTTRRQTRIPMNAQGHQIAFRLTSTSSLQAKVSQIAVFFEMGSQK